MLGIITTGTILAVIFLVLATAFASSVLAVIGFVLSIITAIFCGIALVIEIRARLVKRGL